jgi:hypothetical protein
MFTGRGVGFCLRRTECSRGRRNLKCRCSSLLPSRYAGSGDKGGYWVIEENKLERIGY